MSPGSPTRWRVIGLLTAATLIGACSPAATDSGLADAATACQLEQSSSAAPTRETRGGLADIDALPVEQLQINALAAQDHAQAAARAAAADERWTALAEATAYLDRTAQTFVAAATAGDPPSQALTEGEWNDLKAASNVWILECRDVQMRWQTTAGQ